MPGTDGRSRQFGRNRIADQRATARHGRGNAKQQCKQCPPGPGPTRHRRGLRVRTRSRAYIIGDCARATIDRFRPHRWGLSFLCDRNGKELTGARSSKRRCAFDFKVFEVKILRAVHEVKRSESDRQDCAPNPFRHRRCRHRRGRPACTWGRSEPGCRPGRAAAVPQVPWRRSCPRRILKSALSLPSPAPPAYCRRSWRWSLSSAAGPSRRPRRPTFVRCAT